MVLTLSGSMTENMAPLVLGGGMDKIAPSLLADVDTEFELLAIIGFVDIVIMDHGFAYFRVVDVEMRLVV